MHVQTEDSKNAENIVYYFTAVPLSMKSWRARKYEVMTFGYKTYNTLHECGKQRIWHESKESETICIYKILLTSTHQKSLEARSTYM